MPLLPWRCCCPLPPARRRQYQQPFSLCPEGDLPHGARWKICVTETTVKSAFEGLARNRRGFLHARIGPDALSGDPRGCSGQIQDQHEEEASHADRSHRGIDRRDDADGRGRRLLESARRAPDEGTGTGGHACRRSQLVEPTGSHIPRQLPRSWRGDLRSAAHATDVRFAARATVAAEHGAVGGWTSGRAERRRSVPAQLSILPSGRRHWVTHRRSSPFSGSFRGRRSNWCVSTCSRREEEPLNRRPRRRPLERGPISIAEFRKAGNGCRPSRTCRRPTSTCSTPT